MDSKRQPANLEREILLIKKRNAKVEADKAWETSISRKILVALFTYLMIVIFFYAAGLSDPWRNSLVPALAFFISTSTMPFFKKLWLKHIRSS